MWLRGYLATMDEARYQKLLSWGSDNFYPSASRDKKTSIKDFSNEWEKELTRKNKTGDQVINTAETATLVGRVYLSRKQGRLRFLQLKDITGTIQLFVLKTPETEELFDKFDSIDIGDIMEVSGHPMLTKTGQFSLYVISINPLVKNLVGMNKWDTVEDPEKKYRNRHIDLAENECSKQVFMARAAIISFIRRYLEDDDFIEVETPILTTARTGANAKAFETHHNAFDMDMYLRVAPELYLKKCLVGGFERVFEIGKNFRNEGVSSRHNPEFTSVEFYESYATYHDMIARAKEIISGIALMMDDKFPMFQRDFNPYTSAVVTMLDATKAAMQKRNISFPEELTGEVLFKLFEQHAEPFLVEDYQEEGKPIPVFIVDYPIEVSPLAKTKKDTVGTNLVLTERFELYINGIEIANAFSELNDPRDQEERFNKQVEIRKSHSGGVEASEAMDACPSFVEALEFGLGPCVGAGFGCDRLVSVFTGANSIKDVILFPTMK